MSHLSPIRGYRSSTGAAISTGLVGEIYSSTVTFASAISMTNGTKTTITSFSLPAGTWDVSGFFGIYNTNAAFPTPFIKYAIGAISQASANFTWDDGAVCPIYDNAGGSFNSSANKICSAALPIKRIVIAAGATTPVYLVAQCLMTQTPTIRGYGKLLAVRRG